MRALTSSVGAMRIIVILGILLVWEISVRLWGDPMFMAPPSEIVRAMPSLLSDPKVIGAFGSAFVEIVIAFVCAAVVGATVGLFLGLTSLPRRSLLPIVFVLYAVPQSIVMPLFVLFLGIGPVAKIAFGFTHGVFAVTLSVAAGVQSLDPSFRRAATSMGANQWQVLRHIVLPHMVPSFFTGLRLCMTGVTLGVLLAELYVSMSGVGYFTRHFTERFQAANLFALIAVLAIMAVVLNGACRIAEAHFGRWHR